MAQNALDGVHRLQQAADGRYLTAARGSSKPAATHVLLTLSSVQDDADFDALGPTDR